MQNLQFIRKKYLYITADRWVSWKVPFFWKSEDCTNKHCFKNEWTLMKVCSNRYYLAYLYVVGYQGQRFYPRNLMLDSLDNVNFVQSFLLIISSLVLDSFIWNISGTVQMLCSESIDLIIRKFHLLTYKCNCFLYS